MAKLSKGVKEILDYIKESQGELEFSAEDALTIWGGAEASKVADLTQMQLLQYALVSLSLEQKKLADLLKVVNEVAVKPNRKARRDLEKGKLIL
jgi:hypothetical protein